MAGTKIVIELQRTLIGWGERFDRLETDLTDQVKAMIDNELAVQVDKKDVPTDPPAGLQAQPPVMNKE